MDQCLIYPRQMAFLLFRPGRLENMMDFVEDEPGKLYMEVAHRRRGEKNVFKKKQVFAKSSGQKTQQQQQQQQIPCVGKKSNQEIMQLSLGILLDLIVPKQNGGHLFYPPNLDLYHGIHHHFSPPLIWQMFVTFSKHRRFANRSPRLQPKNSRKGPPNWPFFS